MEASVYIGYTQRDICLWLGTLITRTDKRAATTFTICASSGAPEGHTLWSGKVIHVIGAGMWAGSHSHWDRGMTSQSILQNLQMSGGHSVDPSPIWELLTFIITRGQGFIVLKEKQQDLEIEGTHNSWSKTRLKLKSELKTATLSLKFPEVANSLEVM